MDYNNHNLANDYMRVVGLTAGHAKIAKAIRNFPVNIPAFYKQNGNLPKLKIGKAPMERLKIILNGGQDAVKQLGMERKQKEIEELERISLFGFSGGVK